VETDIASEFRYRRPLAEEDCLFIAVSQSGETIDTLAALKEAGRLGAKTLAITNVVASSIAREAQAALYTYAGPEIAVASTKAYTTQIMLFFLLALYLAGVKNSLPDGRAAELLEEAKSLPEKLHQLLEDVEPIKIFAQQYASKENVFFVGRLLDYAVALEGSLKLKEISYIHAEAYAAGELKHGTLALIVTGTPVIAIATQPEVYEKTISNIQEIKAREASVIGLALSGNADIAKYVDHAIYIPRVDKYLAPILAVVPLQLLSYYAALTRGCNVDKPRNLAKSVTVE
jgi:glucosamine--fructose-6-phosphate aminotransferase (isomerizing)